MTVDRPQGNRSYNHFHHDYSDRPIIPILGRLEDVRPCGNGWVAGCPAHRDRNPSLSVSEGAGRQALLYCHAGCEIDDILESIGLDRSALHPRLRIGRRGPAPPLPEFLRHPSQIPTDRPQPARDRSDDLRLFQSLLRLEHLEELGRQIGVPVEAFAEFELGYLRADGYDGCIIIPERDARGMPVGLLRRYVDGRKLALPGSRRALVIPRYCFHRPGPVFVPEGFSDAAVISHAGFPTIGRPSANGGLEYLVELFETVERDIVVLGENDQKEDGRWPGREGAERVVADLTARLERPVRLIMPPAGCKDARSVFQLGGVELLQHWLYSAIN